MCIGFLSYLNRGIFFHSFIFQQFLITIKNFPLLTLETYFFFLFFLLADGERLQHAWMGLCYVCRLHSILNSCPVMESSSRKEKSRGKGRLRLCDRKCFSSRHDVIYSPRYIRNPCCLRWVHQSSWTEIQRKWKMWPTFSEKLNWTEQPAFRRILLCDFLWKVDGMFPWNYTKPLIRSFLNR